MRRAFRHLPGVPAEVDATAAEVVHVLRRVRRRLGAGLPERFYHRAAEIELAREAIPFASKPAFEVSYEGERLGFVYPDLVVRGHLVVELKAVEALLPIHHTQALTYLTATGMALALLVNCHAVPLGGGIRRLVNADPRRVPPSWGPGVVGS